jgi:hypothetical protein
VGALGRLLGFAGIFSFFLGSCASLPEEILDFKSLPQADTSPFRILELVPEPLPDVSGERLAAPPSGDMALMAPEPPEEAPDTPLDGAIAGLTPVEPEAPLDPPRIPAAPLAAMLLPPLPPQPPAPPPTTVAAEKPVIKPPPEKTRQPLAAPATAESFPVSGASGGDAVFPPSGGAATITTGPPRRISGIVGRQVTVVLPGIGWIYVPGEDAGGKVRYVGKIVEEGNTEFTFALFERGDYNLKFQQQDLAANTVRYDDVNLAVHPPGAAAQPSPPAASPPPADTAVERPPREPAPQSPDPAPAAGSSPPESGSELQRLQKLAEEGQPEALARLEEYVIRHQTELEGLDELYFSLARMFEKDTPARDMKKSLLYYERVRDLFPLSRLWSESDTKSRYIRLNYFDIH